MVSPYDSSDHAVVERRRWKAVTLVNRGLTHRQVAEEMSEDYHAHNPSLSVEQIQAQVGMDIHRALKEYRKRNEQAVEERITAQSLRFAELRRRLFGVLARHHYVLHQGEIVNGPDGNPLRDEGPVLAAIAQLQQLEDRQAKLEGTYQREKLDIALERRVEDEAADVVEAILAGANAVDLEPALRQRMLEAASAHLRPVEGEVVSDTDDGETT